MIRDIIVIGGGAGGIAAAISAKKNHKDVLLIERLSELGGILNQCIHNGFGLEMFKEELTGPEYANIYIKKFEEMKIDCLLDTTVIGLQKKSGIFHLTASSLKTGITEIEAKAVIVTTGCYERTRGSITIPGDRPAGVITAGSAQRYLNIDGYMVGKRIFILGSGDIGLIMARRMRLEGAEVLGVAELMPYSNGLTRNVVQCLNDFDIPLYLSHTVTDIVADENQRVKRIVIQQVDDKFRPIPGTEKPFDVDTLLLSIGLIPDTALLSDLNVLFDPRTKSMKVSQACEADERGLFLAGNVLQVHDLADNVSLESERAGVFASRYIDGEVKEARKVNVIPKKNLLYVSPQYVDFGWENTPVTFSFRANRKIEKALLKVYQSDKEIKTKRFNFVVPAEMESLQINIEEFNDLEEITLVLEEIV